MGLPQYNRTVAGVTYNLVPTPRDPTCEIIDFFLYDNVTNTYEISCRLPSGLGPNLLTFGVSSGGLFTAESTVQYRLPLVTGVQAASAGTSVSSEVLVGSVTQYTLNLPTTGGDFTFTGSNFGANGYLDFLGSELVGGFLGDATTPFAAPLAG